MNRNNIYLDYIIENTFTKEAHQNWVVNKSSIPHPLLLGFRRSFPGFRLRLRDNRSVHADESTAFYYFHWDHRDPAVDVWGHLVEDAPYLIVLAGLGIACGITIALALTNRNRRKAI